MFWFVFAGQKRTRLLSRINEYILLNNTEYNDFVSDAAENNAAQARLCLLIVCVLQVCGFRNNALTMEYNQCIVGVNAAE